MSLIVLVIELTEKTINKELGRFIVGSPQGLSFSPKVFESNQKRTWNTNHLHGIAWKNGKLD